MSDDNEMPTDSPREQEDESTTLAHAKAPPSFHTDSDVSNAADPVSSSPSSPETSSASRLASRVNEPETPGQHHHADQGALSPTSLSVPGRKTAVTPNIPHEQAGNAAAAVVTPSPVHPRSRRRDKDSPVS